MKPAPSPRIARDSVTTGIDCASPPTTLATTNSTHAIVNATPAPERSMTVPAIGKMIATVTLVAPTVAAISPTPPMSSAAVGNAVVTISASSDPRKVAPRAATISARYGDLNSAA